jgi:hypothetical protein
MVYVDEMTIVVCVFDSILVMAVVVVPLPLLPVVHRVSTIAVDLVQVVVMLKSNTHLLIGIKSTIEDSVCSCRQKRRQVHHNQQKKERE